MTPEVAAITTIGVVFTAFFGWLGARGKQTEAFTSRMENRVAAVEERLDATERRERLLSDYVLTLRRHISDGSPPPPPPWPEGLI